ncbi:carboxypeptidase regulatory-like domain-containing protein [Leucobacter coleopterorum]|uniref:Carboxypeptidase regulatory-like domain-containing protein n=1 Tax=Leucobacter coleopterorum TaxID=2714933 RepID=A0ABX6JXX5_9MICO|nr:carboxypeptidase regulatory-like domain-containing protein [Leucobacter coleopterorum]
MQTVKTSADGSWHAKNLDAGSYAVRISADQFGEGGALDGFAAAEGWSATTGCHRRLLNCAARS